MQKLSSCRAHFYSIEDACCWEHLSISCPGLPCLGQDFCAGTAEFMSPEVLMSEDYGLSSDIFSLGMIFVEMLTGKEPSATFPERPPQVSATWHSPSRASIS